MKLKNKIIFTSLAFATGVVGATSLAIGLSSCGENQTASSVVISANKQFIEKEKQYYDSDNKLPLYVETTQSSRDTNIAHQKSILGLYEMQKQLNKNLKI